MTDWVRRPQQPASRRDELREAVRIAIERTRAGKSARSVLIVGLRGVGKTVLLDRMRDDAEASGVHTLRIEAPEDRSLPALLGPQLRVALLRLSKLAKDLAVRGLRALSGFAKGLKVTYGDIEATVESPITTDDVERATTTAVAALDESFFCVRFDRLIQQEKRYLRAMAELGAGPHRSGAIADCLNREVSSLGPVRSSLIAKGMVWSPGHGDTAFTVPLFDEFMRRIMSGDDWRAQALACRRSEVRK